METIKCTIHSTSYFSFKSYYVVWKPASQSATTRSYFWFKSYYVVWKPEINRDRRCDIVQFKSYYIVWKLLLRPPDETSPGSLNRTMQYGNKHRRYSKNRTKKFKSYYVVWKLMGLYLGQKNHCGCLNRTMQYGN